MKISFSSFISDVLGAVDHAIEAFVKTGFNQLVENNSETITLIFTLYVIAYGYRALHQTTSLNLSNTALHLVSLLIVHSLLMRWELYDLFFYRIFTNQPGEIVKALMGAVNGQGNSTAEALNSIWSAGFNAGHQLLQIFFSSLLNNLVYLLYGLLVLAVTVATCLYALALLVYAKLAIALLLCLGPLFLVCLLWPATRGFFERWLQALVNYALVPIVTCGLLMLTLSIAQTTLPTLAETAQSAQGGASGLWPYLGLCLLNALLLRQVMPTCAALSGGLSLENVGQTMPLAQQTLTRTGASAAVRQGLRAARTLYPNKET